MKKHKQRSPPLSKGSNSTKAGKTTGSTGAAWRQSLTMVVLAVLALLVYGSATTNGLLNWDDNFYITESAYLKNLSWVGIKGIFTAYLVGNYHPLTLLSYAIEYAAAGRIDPVLMHTTNILLHALNTALVYLLGKRLLQDHWGGVITALLFALHPMHVESVAWIAERKDVLYTCFFLLSALAYLRYVEGKNAGTLVASLVFFTLALMSKSAAAALAPLLFVLDYWLSRKLTLRTALEKVPYFALAIGFGVVALSSQAGAMQEDFAPHFPLWQRLLIVGYALAFYVVRFVFPYGLSAIHPYPVEPGEAISPFIGPTVGVVLVLGSFLWFAYRDRRYWRIAVTGIMFFLITIAMVLQFLPVGRAIVAERYTYVPYIGLSLIVARLVVDAWRSGVGRSSYLPYLPATALLIALVIFTGITVKRITVWKDSFTLFADMLSKYPEDGLTHYNRGLTNFYQKNYKASLTDYDACVQYKPDCAPCYFNRGLTYKEMGDMKAVIRDMDLAIRYRPGYADAFRNRGNAKAMLQDYPGSIADFTTALGYTPQDTNVLVNRGLSYHFSADPEHACTDWRAAAQAGSRKAEGLVRDQCK